MADAPASTMEVRMLIDGKLVEAASGKGFDNVNPATEEVVAPPTFVMASAQFIPDHPLRPKRGNRGSDPGASRPASCARGAGCSTPSSDSSTTPGTATARIDP